jgi:hypothetical protein
MCNEIIQDGATALLMDLKGATFMDLDGVGLFREPWGRVSVTNCS